MDLPLFFLHPRIFRRSVRLIEGSKTTAVGLKKEIRRMETLADESLECIAHNFASPTRSVSLDIINAQFKLLHEQRQNSSVDILGTTEEY
uniref:Uncharacterized protein n=1 Tax=Octopus bimaculoides TaxID=37653 RepID=A0A0L8I1T8_OCTBM